MLGASAGAACQVAPHLALVCAAMCEAAASIEERAPWKYCAGSSGGGRVFEGDHLC